MEYGYKYLREIAWLMQLKLRLVTEEEKSSRRKIESGIEETKKALQEFFEKERIQKQFVPLGYMLERMQWDEFEVHVLYLLIAAEVDEGFLAACAQFHGNSAAAYVTPLLAKATFGKVLDGSSLYHYLSQESRLGQLILEKSREVKNQFLNPIMLRERMRAFLFEGTIDYPPYEAFLSIKPPKKELPFLHDKTVLGQIYKIIKNYHYEKCLILCIQGEKGAGKKLTLQYAARFLNQPLVQFKADQLSTETEKAEWQINSLLQECRLWQGIPVLLHLGEETNPLLYEKLASSCRLVFAVSREHINSRAVEGAVFFTLHMNESKVSASQKVWIKQAERYDIEAGVETALMAEKFQLSAGMIQEAMEIAWLCAVRDGRRQISQADLDRGCYTLLEDRMGKRAVRIKPAFTFDQLVLPAKQKDRLREACSQKKFQHKVYGEWGFEALNVYGIGLSMVFYGPPGTGKTMAAQVIARELGLELYKVELTSIYSKYIGETEKNLDAIFEQARRSQIILFFDEADILFSKRTEIKDSHDKYSNMEAAYLLQKMEAYEGVTILATNYVENFDPAFNRRIKFMVNFPFPEEEQRRQIWKNAIPKKTPHEEIDFEFLSTFHLSGAQIKNIVLAAAFRAASGDVRLGMEQLVPALKNEYEKNGRMLQNNEMREYAICIKDDEYRNRGLFNFE